MQDTDKDLLETHGQYSSNMGSTYHISEHTASFYGSLVDMGTNGGLAGAGVCVLERTGRKVSQYLLETHGQYSANMTSTYHISEQSASSYGSLVDRGANGGLAGAGVCVLERTGRKVSVAGKDDHELPGLDIVTCAALIQTNHGKVDILMHECLLW